MSADGSPAASPVPAEETAPQNADDSSSSSNDGDAAAVPLPADAAGWRTRLAAVPARSLFDLIRKEKPRSARIFAGFRPSAALVSHPIIVTRLVEEAQREPGFAREVGGIDGPLPPSPSPIGMGAGGTEEEDATLVDSLAASPPPSVPPAPIPMGEGEGGRGPSRINQKLKEQRAVLRQRDSRIADLESALTQAERERDAARSAVEAARASLQRAEEEASRLRRQREREARRAEKTSPAPAKEDASALRRPVREDGPPPVTVAVPPPSLLEEGVRRLLRRGKHAAAADVCREALIGLTESGSGGARGAGAATVHALFAEALYGLGEEVEAAAQDRQAASAYLDDARVVEAAESLARALLVAGAAGGDKDSSGDIALLRRLFALAQRAGQEEAAVGVFLRLRLTGPPAVYARFRRLLERTGKPLAALLERARKASVAETPLLTMGETIPLPGLPEGITPAGAVRAVESGDAAKVIRIRDGLSALRQTNPPLLDAFLGAVAAILPPAAALLAGNLPLPRPVVVDASNVARYDPDPLAMTPPSRVANLLRMRDFLLTRGYFPVMMIADANLRYHVDEQAVYEQMVERGVVAETPPRTSADERIIREARERGALIVTNDRLLEWEDAAWGIDRRGFGIFPDRISLLIF